jgi:hypothetical protein
VISAPAAAGALLSETALFSRHQLLGQASAAATAASALAIGAPQADAGCAGGAVFSVTQEALPSFTQAIALVLASTLTQPCWPLEAAFWTQIRQTGTDTV